MSALTDMLRIEPTIAPELRAAKPLMLMILPQPRAFMIGATARAQRRYPNTLTFTSWLNCSSSRPSIPVTGARPNGRAALFTSMSMPSNLALASLTARRTDSLSPVSTTTGWMLRPVSDAISPAVAASASKLRAAIATSQPSRASSRAIAFPMPLLPPVTRAFLPTRFRSIYTLPFGNASSGARFQKLVACSNACASCKTDMSA